jgi:hypothetical protein
LSNFAILTWNGCRYGQVEFTVELCTKLWSIDKELGGSECVVVYVERLNGSVLHLKLARFLRFLRFWHV